MKVPRILNKLIIEDRQFVVVEKISGIKFEFYFKTAETMEKFGESIALIHAHEFMDWEKATYNMLDMDPRQFFIDGDRICAILDTEAYVIGPRELDLVALECSMDETGARAFKKGYSSVIPFPELNLVSETYRFLFCLLEIKGPSVNFKDWISKPHLFD